MRKDIGMVADAYNLSPCQYLGGQCQSSLHSKFQASLGYNEPNWEKKNSAVFFFNEKEQNVNYHVGN